MSEVTKKKKAAQIPAAELDKILKRYIKESVKALTHFATETPGCFARRVIQLQPAQITQWSHADVSRIVREKMPLTAECAIKVCDQFITTYPDEVFERFMSFAIVASAPNYASEQFDCDDFSVAFCATARKWHASLRAKIEKSSAMRAMLPVAASASAACAAPRVIPASPRGESATDEHYIGGSPIGMCHGKLSLTTGEHAFNFWISSQGDIVFIEPQTGEYIMLGDGASVDYVYI